MNEDEKDFYLADSYSPCPTHLGETRTLGAFTVSLSLETTKQRWGTYQTYTVEIEHSSGLVVDTIHESPPWREQGQGALGELAFIATMRKNLTKGRIGSCYRLKQTDPELAKEWNAEVQADFSDWIKTRNKLRKSGELESMQSGGSADLVRTEQIMKLLPLIDRLSEAAQVVRSHGSEYTKKDIAALKVAIKALPHHQLVQLRKYGRK